MTKPKVTFRKQGNLLEISSQGAAPPKALADYAELNLSYNKVTFLYGLDRYMASSDGRPRNIESRPVSMCKRDIHGRLVCGYGFAPRLRKAISELGYDLEEFDITPTPENPDAFNPNLGLVHSRFTFRPKQEECLRAIMTNPAGGLVHAVTGFGKMVMIAMTCVLYPKATFAVVVKGRDLANKTRAFLSNHVPSVGMVGDSKRERGRVTVYTAGSLRHYDGQSDFLICDEAHELMADTYVAELARSMNARRYAFTASPKGRSDGTDIRLESMFGPCIFHIPYQEAVNLQLVVPIRVEWSDVFLPDYVSAGCSGPAKDRLDLWTNNGRNAVIAKKARTFGDDEQVQILVKTIEHAVHLRKHLPEYTLVYGDMEMADRRKYVRDGLLPETEPEMTPARRIALRQQFEAGHLKKVISTAVWAVGIDPVFLAALIRADAGASEITDIQAPGRVARRAAGKAVGVVCDFRDQFDSALARKARKRQTHYEALGWEQVNVGGK